MGQDTIPDNHQQGAQPGAARRGIEILPSRDGHGSVQEEGEKAGPPEEAAHALPGPCEAIGQYEIIRELGRGGMGAVYLARDTRLGRRVAVKFLQTTGSERGRTAAAPRTRSTRRARPRPVPSKQTPGCRHCSTRSGSVTDSSKTKEEIMYSTTWISRRICRPGKQRAGLAVLMMQFVGAGQAAAQEAPRVKPAEVSLEVRAQARELFLEGNKLLKIPLFADAADKYKEALALWPHPAFHYNLVIAQLNLVQPVEAYHSLEKAMERGPEILGERRYQQGLRYRAQLQKQLGFVTVRCDERGAQVRLDGQPLFIGPGDHEVVVLPGSHQIVASMSGRIPETREIVISPGERIEVEMRLRLPERVETERHVPAWAPWAGMGVGVAVVAVGGYLDWDSTQALQEHDNAFNRDCPRGCTTAEADVLAPRLSRADSEKRAALGLYIGGGALAVGSAILIYVNRERVVRTEAQPGAVSVTPVWSSTMAGLSVSGGF